MPSKPHQTHTSHRLRPERQAPPSQSSSTAPCRGWNYRPGWCQAHRAPANLAKRMMISIDFTYLIYIYNYYAYILKYIIGIYRIFYSIFSRNYFFRTYICQNPARHGRFAHAVIYQLYCLVWVGFIKVNKTEWPWCWTRGGISISCFQVHSIIETGFRMVLVEHCVFGPVIPVRYVAGVLN